MARNLPLLLVLLSLSWAGHPIQGAESRELVIRGRIICLDSDQKPVPCSDHAGLFALETAPGQRYYFSPEDRRSRVFEDERVRSRELEIRVWPREQGQVEILKVYSVKDGKLFDLHYYCAVCSITAFVGGPCWCCQEEFEFREVQVD